MSPTAIETEPKIPLSDWIDSCAATLTGSSLSWRQREDSRGAPMFCHGSTERPWVLGNFLSSRYVRPCLDIATPTLAVANKTQEKSLPESRPAYFHDFNTGVPGSDKPVCMLEESHFEIRCDYNFKVESRSFRSE